jgi:hypothetical protein
MITVAETGPYRRKAITLLSETERSELISYLSEFPAAGVLIQGTGGVRKLRWARGGRGKSGGVRVIYYFHSERMPLYLLAVFGKNEKADLSAEERAALAKAVRELVSYWRLNDGQGIH